LQPHLRGQVLHRSRVIGFIPRHDAPILRREAPPYQTDRLVAASDSSRRSKPRSFASLIVVCTHTPVVIPVKTRFRSPARRRINSRSVAWQAPFSGRSFRRDAAVRTGVANACADATASPLPVGGQTREVRAMVFAGMQNEASPTISRPSEFCVSARSRHA